MVWVIVPMIKRRKGEKKKNRERREVKRETVRKRRKGEKKKEEDKDKMRFVGRERYLWRFVEIRIIM